MLEKDNKLAIYMPHHVGSPNGKMGYGLLRYSEQPIACVIDPDKAGSTVQKEVGIRRKCPIVGTLEEAKDLGADALVIGIAPSGGRIPDEWRPDLAKAVDLGFCIVNGLHDAMATTYGERLHGKQWIWDIRKEEPGIGVAKGLARTLPNKRILCVGTDMAIGKMTAALELWRGARTREWNAAFVATGQIGIAISGGGVALDAIRVDYACGAVERAVLEHRGADVIFVEGQGALGHPGSTSTLPLIRGSAPTHLILCHRAGQESLRDYADIPIPALGPYLDLYCDVAGNLGSFTRPVALGICVNTAGLADHEAREYVEQLGSETDLPVTDAVRFGVAPLLDALE